MNRLKPWTTPQASPLWKLLPEIHRWNLDNLHRYSKEDIDFQPIRKDSPGWRDDSWMIREPVVQPNGKTKMRLTRLVKGQSTGYRDLARDLGYEPSWFWCAALIYVRGYGNEVMFESTNYTTKQWIAIRMSEYGGSDDQTKDSIHIGYSQ